MTAILNKQFVKDISIAVLDVKNIYNNVSPRKCGDQTYKRDYIVKELENTKGYIFHNIGVDPPSTTLHFFKHDQQTEMRLTQCKIYVSDLWKMLSKEKQKDYAVVKANILALLNDLQLHIQDMRKAQGHYVT